MSNFFLLIIILICFNEDVKASENNDYATVLMYHRFNDSKYPSTSISSELFESHLQYLKKKNYSVLPITDLVDFFEQNNAFPKKTIFITIDDGYKSFYEYAFPLLLKYKFPFTVFISTDYISNNDKSDFMTWEMLKEIKAKGGSIQNHTSNHANLNEMDIKEIRKVVLECQKELDLKLGIKSDVFSFPYGMSSIKNETIIKEMGFKLAFGQQSSHIFYGENKFRLPRFSFNQELGEIKRFEMIIESFPLEVFDVIPEDTLFRDSQNQISFSTNHPLSFINCYHSSNTPFEIRKLPPSKIEIQFKDKLNKGVNRVNCTAYDKNKNLYWYGKILIH